MVSSTRARPSSTVASTAATAVWSPSPTAVRWLRVPRASATARAVAAWTATARSTLPRRRAERASACTTWPTIGSSVPVNSTSTRASSRRPTTGPSGSAARGATTRTARQLRQAYPHRHRFRRQPGRLAERRSGIATPQHFAGKNTYHLCRMSVASHHARKAR